MSGSALNQGRPSRKAISQQVSEHVRIPEEVHEEVAVENIICGSMLTPSQTCL